MLLLPQTTFFFKFLKITKLPLYTECKITCAPFSCGSTLDLAVFVRSRFWWQQVCDEAGAQRSLPAETTVEMCHSQRISSVTQHWIMSMGRSSWLKTASEKDRQRVRDPFATACHYIYFSIDEMSPFFIGLLGFFL